MSITVNDHKIKIEQYDSVNTIMDKIAIKLKNVPSQIVIFRDDEIVARDSLSKIITDTQLVLASETSEKINFTAIIFKDVISPLIDKYGYDLGSGFEDISHIVQEKKIHLFHWINKVFEKTSFSEKFKKCGLIFTAEKYKGFQVYIEQFLPNVNSNIICDEYERYFRDIEEESISLEKRKEFYKTFDTITKRQLKYVTTPYITDRSIITLKVQVEDGINYHELFDGIRLSKTVPMAYLHTIGLDNENNYYKVLDNFDIPTEWVKRHQLPSRLVMKIAHVQNLKMLDNMVAKKAVKMYSTAMWTITDEKKGLAEIMISVTISKGIDPNDVIQRMLDVLPQEFKIISRRETSGGTYSIGNMAINKFIFLDMLTNHPIISTFFHVDETVKVTTEKKNLYIYFQSVDTFIEGMTATISQYRANMNLFGNKILENEPFITLRLHAKNVYFVNVFRAFFDYAMEIYNADYEKIFKVYKNVVDDSDMLDKEYGIKEPIKVKFTQLKMLKHVNPDLFGQNYSRDCNFKPTYVDPAEVPDYIDRRVPLLEFPEGSGDNYRCADESHPYPYLKQARFKENKKEFPFVPCCAILDPMEKGVSSMLSYKGLIDEKRVAKQIIDKPKQMQPARQGALIRVLDNLFSMYGSSDKIHFTRLGVANITAPDSILQCMLRIFNKEFHATDQSQKTAFANKYRKNILANDELAIASGKQELFDMSINDIKNSIARQVKTKLKGYLDPRKYIRIMETHFECNIFLFTETPSEPDGTMLLPYYRDTYYIYPLNKKRDTVFLYCHDVGDGFYVSEIIGKGDRLKFSYIDEKAKINLPQTVYNFYLRFLTSYTTVNNTINVDILRAKPKTKLFTGQIIDGAGKMRAVIANKNIIIALPPSPPLPLPILSSTDGIGRTMIPKIENVINFISENELTVLGKCKTDTMNGILTRDDDITYFLPYSGKNDFIDGLQIIDPPFNINFPTIFQTSMLKKYIHTRKIATFLKQYVLFAFSIYIQKEIAKMRKKSEPFDPNEYVDKFENDGIIIKEIDYYDVDIPIMLSTNIGLFDNDRLIASNEIVKDKLIYYLKSVLNISNEYVINYSENHTSLLSYAQEHSDFTHNDGELIFLNLQSFSQWVQERVSSPIIHFATNQNHADLIFPYFIKTVDERIFLIQNVPNTKIAIAINNFWDIHGINLGYYTQESDETIDEKNISIFETDSRGYIYQKRRNKNVKMSILKYPEDDKIAVMLEIVMSQ